jgi:hypothetical protein
MFTLTDGVDTVELRNPELLNKHALDKNAIVHYTSSGVVHIGYTGQTDVDTREYQFQAIQNADDLVTLLSNNVGKLLTVTDHNNASFTGYVLNETVDISTQHTDEFVLNFLVVSVVINYLVTDAGDNIVNDAGDKLIC